MIILRKIAQYVEKFYRRYVVVEQYPMLTSVSRNRLMKEGAMGVVYMLHHISEKDQNRIPTNEDLKISPSFLKKIIVKYKRYGFDFISLDQLYTIITSVKRPDKPFVVFTIDDGYLDNYKNALPVFAKYDVPFAIFVATDFVDKEAILWWDCLENLILTHEEIVINTKERFSCRTFQERWDSFRILRERILNFDQNRIKEELTSMFSDYEIDWLAPVREKGMSWDQIRELSRHPLCTIGGHTISHPALNKLSLEEAKREIQNGIKILEQAICKPVHYFAFPYGTPNEIGEREFQIVRKLGIKLAFMAHEGCITNDNIRNITHLPRVYFRES